MAKTNELLDSIDTLVSVEKDEIFLPKPVWEFLEEVFKRNDSLPKSSKRRASLVKTRDYLIRRGYKFSDIQMRRIARENFGRESWGHA